MFLYEMTWDEVAELSKGLVVVLPFGAVEQHSHHLPLGTDSLIAEAIARRIEREAPSEILVLPTIWLGCSRHHMNYAGSLTAEVESFIQTGREVVLSMAKHGFRNFLLLNGHGGNISKLSILAEKLYYDLEENCKVVGVTYWDLIAEEIQSIRETPVGGMGHACELETSIVLAVRPDLVREHRREADGPAQLSQFEERDMFVPGKVTVVKSFDKISRHGGVGDPCPASAEKGERIMAAVVQKLRTIVTEIRTGFL